MRVLTFELKHEIDLLNSLIEQYEEIKLNLFHQLEDSCLNWHDGNSVSFEEKVYAEKKEADRNLEILKSKKEIYDYIYMKYSVFGKKIVCDLGKKNEVMRMLFDCEKSFRVISNSFDNLYSGFHYEKKADVFEVRSKFFKLRNQFLNLKEQIEMSFKKFEQIEKEISNKISELEELSVQDFEFIWR